MRIVGGRHRGRKLESPAGSDTRPTADRVRESLFNVLRHAAFLDGDAVEDALVLDAFAGTGALGLEALSAGAAHAVFIETARPALAALKTNIGNLKEEARTQILAADALNPPPRPAAVAPRTLVFLDPPYGQNLGAPCLAALLKTGWLAPGALVVLETADKTPESPPAPFTPLDSRRWGVARVTFLRCP